MHTVMAWSPSFNMAMEAGVDYFGVYSADEAYALAQFRVRNDPDVFIMGMVEDEAIGLGR